MIGIWASTTVDGALVSLMLRKKGNSMLNNAISKGAGQRNTCRDPGVQTDCGERVGAKCLGSCNQRPSAGVENHPIHEFGNGHVRPLNHSKVSR